MTAPQPPLYDVNLALLELAAYRTNPDRLGTLLIHIAADLAGHMERHFPDPVTREAAGRALLIGAASIGALADCGPEAMVNILGLAGQNLTVPAIPTEEQA